MIARRLGYATTCLTCEERIESDERAFAERGIGAWHEDCYEPLNLDLYRRERDRGLFRRQRRKHTALDLDE